jgi:hypothetical protein
MMGIPLSDSEQPVLAKSNFSIVEEGDGVPRDDKEL